MLKTSPERSRLPGKILADQAAVLRQQLCGLTSYKVRYDAYVTVYSPLLTTQLSEAVSAVFVRFKLLSFGRVLESNGKIWLISFHGLSLAKTQFILYIP